MTEIRAEDLMIQTFRNTGPVGMGDRSAHVRLTHLPTGLVADGHDPQNPLSMLAAKSVALENLSAMLDAQDGPTEPEEWVVALPPGFKLMNLNDRMHWRTRHRITKETREMAATLARSAKVPKLETAHIVVVLHPHDKRRRDPHNWAPSAKAAIDGITDAGVLPDDDSKHLLSLRFEIGDPVKHNQLALRITGTRR